MSHLATVFRSSSMSKLPDADRKPFPTLRVIIIANRKSSRKILKNFWLSILLGIKSARPSYYHELSNYRIIVSVRVGHTQFSNSLILDRSPNQQNFTYISGIDVFFRKKSMPLFQRSRCKDTHFIFGTVRICPYMSENVRFCPFFLLQNVANVAKKH